MTSMLKKKIGIKLTVIAMKFVYSFCVLWLYWVVRVIHFNGNAIIQGSVKIKSVIQCFKMRK